MGISIVESPSALTSLIHNKANNYLPNINNEEGVSIFNRVVTGEIDGDVIALNSRKSESGVIYREGKNLTYIEYNGRRHNIITDGGWKYPVLVKMSFSLDTNGSFISNIIIYKRQIAKKLVYFKTNKLIRRFDECIINSANFHLINSSNVQSYLDVYMNLFNNEINDLNNRENVANIEIDRAEYLRTYDYFLRKFRHSGNTNIVAGTKSIEIRNGSLFCWPVHFFLTLADAKNLVYWNKQKNKKEQKYARIFKYALKPISTGRTYRRMGEDLVVERENNADRGASIMRSLAPTYNVNRIDGRGRLPAEENESSPSSSSSIEFMHRGATVEEFHNSDSPEVQIDDNQEGRNDDNQGVALRYDRSQDHQIMGDFGRNVEYERAFRNNQNNDNQEDYDNDD